MSSKDSRAAFPYGIRALVVDSDARFLRSATLMLSLLNFLVATCETPTSAVKLLTGRLKDADVVFIDALRAATCGFDFRGLVEPHLCIPVIYSFSLDYNVAGEVAEALRRTVSAATYVIKKPLDAGDLCRLWSVIGWSKFLLRRGENTLPWTEWPRGNQALPAAIQALLPSYQQPAQQNRRGVQATDVQNQQHGRSLFMQREMFNMPRNNPMISADTAGPSSSNAAAFTGLSNTSAPALLTVPVYQAMGVQNQQHGSLFMQLVTQILNSPRNNAMISADAAGPSSSNVAAFTGASNISAPALLPAYQAPARARATSPAPHAVYSAQAPAPGLSPPAYQQQPAARAGRGRPRRKLADSQDVGSSGSGHAAGSLAIAGQRTGRQEQMINVTEGKESDDDNVLPSHLQLAQQNRRGVQTMDIQNQQQGWSVFMQRVYQMLNVPRNNPMISKEAAGPSSSNATAFASTSNISAPALLPAYQAQARKRARETSPGPHVVYSAQAAAPGLPPPVHQQQLMAAVPTIAATSGHQPQFTLNQQQQQEDDDMSAPRRQGSWMRDRHETGPIMLCIKQQPPAVDPFTPMAGGDTTFGASPRSATDAGAYGDITVADIQSSSVGAQPADSFDDELRAMMEMNDTFPRSYYDNSSAEELLAPATDKDKLAATQAAPGSSNSSNYNDGSFRVSDVNGSNSASFMVPQDLTVPTGNQEELGALDIYGSLAVASPGTISAMFDWNGDMAAMFPSDQYDENTTFMHPEGQQVAAADSTTPANATGIISNGGESGGWGPNWNMGATDDGLDMLEEHLKDDNVSDFQPPQDMNSGHQ